MTAARILRAWLAYRYARRAGYPPHLALAYTLATA